VVARQEAAEAALEGLAGAIGGYHSDVVELRPAVEQAVVRFEASVASIPAAAAASLAEALSIGLAEAVAAIRDAVERAGSTAGASQQAVLAGIEGLEATIAERQVDAAAVGAAIGDLRGALEVATGSLSTAVGEGFFDAAARQAALLEAVPSSATTWVPSRARCSPSSPRPSGPAR
jgi:hypothetical protein